MTDQPGEEGRNEIIAAVEEVKAQSDAALRAARDRVRTWPLAGIGLGVGIGSAAVAAAVLFASRQRRAEKDR